MFQYFALFVAQEYVVFTQQQNSTFHDLFTFTESIDNQQPLFNLS